MSDNIERKLLENIPENINYISRDEMGEVWLSEEKPCVVEGSGGKYLSFPQPTSLDNLYSLAVYNHLFKFLDNLSIMEIDLGNEKL